MGFLKSSWYPKTLLRLFILKVNWLENIDKSYTITVEFHIHLQMSTFFCTLKELNLLVRTLIYRKLLPLGFQTYTLAIKHIDVQLPSILQ